MQIISFLSHYQLVYISFDISSFSLISYYITPYYITPYYITPYYITTLLLTTLLLTTLLLTTLLLTPYYSTPYSLLIKCFLECAKLVFALNTASPPCLKEAKTVPHQLSKGSSNA